MAETSGFVPGETAWFAVKQELRPGWHVFWVNPGDAGLPLELDWSLPQGFSAGEILHPAPEYIPVGPLASYAHEGAPVFLIPVTAPQDAQVGDVVDVAIDARWQICEEICVPEEGRFSFSVPVVETSTKDPKVQQIFSTARAALPDKLSKPVKFSVLGGDYVLQFSPPNEFSATNAFFFAEPEGLVEPSAPQTISLEDGAANIAMKPGWIDRYDGDALRGVLTFTDVGGGRRTFSLIADVPAPIVKPSDGGAIAQTQSTPDVLLLLVLAFLGGVILNVMPCVFPIVFIKAASFMRSAQKNSAAVRRDGVLYTAGVLATFLAVGGALLLLRAGGEQLGWGFHLQSPWVVALSAYVLFLVGLNLAGVFAIGESLAGSGETLAGKGGAAGSFFTGALAVVVAAPCIGPLLSAPIGAAILLPPAFGMLIFLALGLGLAAPYLVLSFAPGLGRLLPKPGGWMATFKQVLAFPVFAAAAYFLWVLSQQASTVGLGAVLAGLIFMAFAAWSFEYSRREGRGAFILRILSALAVLLAVAPLFRLEAAASAAQRVDKYGAMTAEPFSKEALDAYRASGVPVFVDFTAAWCVTCQLDKATIFSDSRLADAFSDKGIVFMVADWTVRDPEITMALESFGASGVPLYVYYAPGQTPHVFDIPLTKKAVREIVSAASL
ncbi:protein-disulfide reductase DsbD family protein [Hyphococcus flavus]|uniref:Protein-disulfide reductase DsbD family protein n=1 Tax=Hyphococcus flavus TaxID=1866326 RepID=A0AAE9ZDS0_9PROT|nr:thioredoxin family protein [Hyphococcus flavus]WDI33218.1 protein-disulfide reductase DsbD family protein [Hyphococcus flavus]